MAKEESNDCHLSTQLGWRKALDELPGRDSSAQSPIPAFFFAHGYPGIVYPMNGRLQSSLEGVEGSLHNFLKDFGPTLIKKYQPNYLVVFSAHWETEGEILVSDYGNNQPLLYDYYGFPDNVYQAKWFSHGSTQLSDKIVNLLNQAGINSRKLGKGEVRGEDGLTGPSSGLDHGVFIPFMLMFPEATKKPFHMPVVQVSIEGSLDPVKNIKLGQAISALRHEGALILSGGLTIHTFKDFTAWKKDTASQAIQEFESAIIDASLKKDKEKRLKSLAELKQLGGFRLAHPREEHFVPIWIAAGAGSDSGQTKILTDLHGCKTIAFGVE